MEQKIIETTKVNKVLDVRNLQVWYKRKGQTDLNIVRGVDFSVVEGTIVGVVGESGCGKTTLVRTLSNLNYGAKTAFDFFKVDGEAYRAFEQINWKKTRGNAFTYIPQDPNDSMNPSRKIWRQMVDVLNKHRKGEFASKHAKIQYIIKFLEEMRIVNPHSIMSLYPHQITASLKQRLNIAMAVMSQAKVIIVDEPSNKMDITAQSSILEIIQEINRIHGTTFIIVSQNIGIAAKLCNYVFVMYAGKVVEKASRVELFSNPKHAYTWALMASLPDGRVREESLMTIPGTPPDLGNLLPGDPFAPRNRYATELDFRLEPPLFEVTPTHWAATWMLHPYSPRVEMPFETRKRIEDFKISLINRPKETAEHIEIRTID